MSADSIGPIAVAEKIHDLIEKAPAGGIFHEGELTDVAGVEIPGYSGMAGFTIVVNGGRYEVVVKWA